MPAITIVFVVVGLYFVASVVIAIGLGRLLDNHDIRTSELRQRANHNHDSN